MGKSKLSYLAVVVSLGLTGCIEVEDNNNNDSVVDALNAQNDLLANQNDILNQQIEDQTTVTLHALVVNAGTNAPVEAATVRAIQGESVLAEVTTEAAGLFELEGLPHNSDLTIEISSPTDAFLTRAFFVTTGSNDSGAAFSDLGELRVSESQTVSFAIRNTATNDSIGGLEFVGNSSVGDLQRAAARDYLHVSSYNQETGQYSIELPKDFNVLLEASIDLDDDGMPDYNFESTDFISVSGNQLTVYNPSALNDAVINAYEDEPQPAVEEKTVTFTLVNANGSLVSGAQFILETGSESLVSTYDEATQQYSITVPFSGYAGFVMPSFESNGVTYSSGSVNIDRRTNSVTDEVYLTISSQRFDSNWNYNVEDTANVNIVLTPRVIEPTADVEVVTSALTPTYDTYAVYYSHPVGLDAEQVDVSYEEIQIIAGNDDENDNVPEGYTYIENSTVNVPFELTSELNDTRKTVSLTGPLPASTRVTYQINELTQLSNDVTFELNTDDTSVVTPEDDSVVFDINDLVVDNENFYSNGSPIVATNTAGIAEPRTDRRDTPYLFLPSNIQSLNYLIINMTGYTDNGVFVPQTQQIEAVIDNRVNLSSNLMLKVASNEIVNNNASIGYQTGTSLDNGSRYYRAYLGLYMNDNTATNEQLVHLSYEYQTRSGENASGTLVLPVR